MGLPEIKKKGGRQKKRRKAKIEGKILQPKPTKL
jgi:hypothetical protein